MLCITLGDEYQSRNRGQVENIERTREQNTLFTEGCRLQITDAVVLFPRATAVLLMIGICCRYSVGTGVDHTKAFIDFYVLPEASTLQFQGAIERIGLVD